MCEASELAVSFKPVTHVVWRYSVFCDVPQRGLVVSYRRFGKTKRSHLLRSLCIVVGSRRLMHPDALQPKLIVQTLIFSRSYLHRQVSPPESLVVKGGTTWGRNCRWILPENARLPRNIQGSFTRRKSTTWNKQLYFPSEGSSAEEFCAQKNPRLRPGLNPWTWVPKVTTEAAF